MERGSLGEIFDCRFIPVVMDAETAPPTTATATAAAGIATAGVVANRTAPRFAAEPVWRARGAITSVITSLE